MDNWQVLGLQEAYKMMEDLTSLDKQKVILGILKKTANRNIKAPLEGADRFIPSKSRRGKPFTTVLDKNNSLGVISGVSGKFFHYRFLEFGTRARYTRKKKNKSFRGVMTKSPFIVNTIEANINNCVNTFINDYGPETKKRLDRLARKNK